VLFGALLKAGYSWASPLAWAGVSFIFSSLVFYDFYLFFSFVLLVFSLPVSDFFRSVVPELFKF
jgi:hypothetical protein